MPKMSGDEDLRKGKEKLRQDFEDKHQTFGHQFHAFNLVPAFDLLGRVHKIHNSSNKWS